MKVKKILFAVAIVATALSSFAQNFSSDAFMFSGASNSATARFNAVGGPQTAIGGDLTSLYGNPAGLGMFTKSEFSFTPSYSINNSETKFLGTQTTQSNGHVNLNNIGIVFNNPVAKTSNLTTGVLSFNFGIGYQKTNMFRNDLNFNGGVTNNNGLSDYFSERANAEGRIPEDLKSDLTYSAWMGYLIDNNGSTNTKYNPITTSDSDQKLRVNTKGNQSNVDFSMGINVSNTLYLGATMGLASVNFRSNNTLNEQGITRVKNSNNQINNYDYNTNLINDFDTKGSGVNFKFGAILKPVYEFRIGLSIETPTWYNMTDNFNRTLNLKDIKNIDVSKTENFLFDYKLSTPLKLNGGLSYFIGKKGFLTANINFIDYSNIRFRSNNSAANMATNVSLANKYKEAINYSFGAEFRLADNFMLRAGYTSIGNPYKDIDFKSTNYSGGLGYRFGSYYIDGALIVNQNNIFLNSVQYELNNFTEPTATRNTQATSVSITFGSRF
ncbi:MAG: hypothetical protein EAZ51_08150 [Sphingobacteriales bacterium]|nr:MAG: hypothetical protein EAZ64_08535 [Sphingobacteriales bacterium]TAF79170.1 MAG: hypothetical protein EAZ51_08150 [Sphingobacteriales bacterium]